MIVFPKQQAGSTPAPARTVRAFPLTVILLAAVLALLILRLSFKSPPDFLLSEDRKFECFTQDVFCNELSGNTLNLHYTVASPEAFGISRAPVSLGNAGLDARKAGTALLENYRKKLSSFQYEKLSDKNRLTYDVFDRYLETELAGSAYLLYDEPLSPSLGIQAQLPVLFAEYTFRTKADIENYLTLLTQMPDYFSSILSFEREKASAGLFMGSECAVEIIRQCKSFIDNPSDHYLIHTFSDRINRIKNLTADEKIAYCARNEAILTSYVIPAYEALIEGLTGLLGSSKNEMGLYYLPQGQDYYRYLVRSITGDGRSIEEIEEHVKTRMVADYSAIQKLLSGHPEAAASSSSSAASASDPSAILDELRQKITGDFPIAPDVSCQVKYVHPSLQQHLSPAFYLTPAIDDFQNNVIYINPASGYNDLELYTTLAHEGYPGHLYQSVCFHAQSPDPLRCLLDIGGYTEGWATYVEMYAYSLWEKDPVLSALSQKNRSFTLGLASLLDIGIHYRGYTPDQTEHFLQQLGFSDETAASMYETILEAPGNYLQYYVGYLNFCSLRDTFRQKLGGRFSLKDFHRIILETGPAPFSVLEQQLTNQMG